MAQPALLEGTCCSELCVLIAVRQSAFILSRFAMGAGVSCSNRAAAEGIGLLFIESDTTSDCERSILIATDRALRQHGEPYPLAPSPHLLGSVARRNPGLHVVKPFLTSQPRRYRHIYAQPNELVVPTHRGARVSRCPRSSCGDDRQEEREEARRKATWFS